MSRIGIFDSGIGGLSVWRALTLLRGDLDLLYLADQAHLPYGPRPHDQIRDYSNAIARLLIGAGCTTIVVACNTASAAALQDLRERFPATQFVGMEPAVKPAALHSRSGVVGVLATAGTLAGTLIRNTAARYADRVELITSDCAGLVEAIEADADDAQLQALLQRHAGPMLSAGADTLVLGCTHYPFIADRLQDMAGPAVQLIDPAPAVARQALRIAKPQTGGQARNQFLTSGDVRAFERTASRLLGLSVDAGRVSWHGEDLRPTSRPEPA